MVGKNQLQITATDFIKGSSSSDFTNDGGFSPLSTGLNLNITQGVVKSVTITVDASTNLAGIIIASCNNIGGSVSTNRKNFLDSSGNFYSLASSTLTKQVTGTATYTKGISFMVPFNGNYYASSTTNVSQWNGTTTLTETWFTGLSGAFGGLSATSPHPMIVYNKKLWIADGQYLHSFDGTTLVTDAINLGANTTIYALGLDQGTGLMLISYQSGIDGSLTNGYDKYLALYDGSSSYVSKLMRTNDLALSFQSIGDVVFVGTSRGIGIWSGSGIQQIYKFQTVKYDSDFLPFQSHMTNIGNVLYFVDNQTIYAYGEISQANGMWLRAQKAFYPCFIPVIGAAVGSFIGLITDIGSGELGIYYATSTPTNIFGIQDMNTAGYGATFISNRYEFPRPISIHKIRVFTTGITNTPTGGQVGIYNDENGNTINATLPQMSSTSGTRTWFDFDFGGTKLQMGQFYATIGQTGVGINRIVIYYDTAE